MRIELKTDEDFEGVDFWRGTICAVCNSAIQNPPATWLMLDSLDFFVHGQCGSRFSDEIVKRTIAEMTIVMHDDPPERN